MLRVGKNIYRHALTPEQKDRKKDYLLQQGIRGEKGIPTWDEVKEMIDKSSSDSFYNDVEQWAYEEDVIAQHLAEKLSDQQDDWDLLSEYETVGDIDEVLTERGMSDSDVQRLKQEAAEELVLEQYKDKYDDLVAEIKHIGGEECYRMIALKEGVDPASLEGLGIYWSLEEERAGGYDLDDDFAKTHPHVWLFTAEVDYDVVNVWETVMAQLSPDYSAEVEVQFFKHAQIYVWKAERIEGYNRGYGPSMQESGYSKVVDTVDIDELRRC